MPYPLGHTATVEETSNYTTLDYYSPFSYRFFDEAGGGIIGGGDDRSRLSKRSNHVSASSAAGAAAATASHDIDFDELSTLDLAAVTTGL